MAGRRIVIQGTRSSELQVAFQGRGSGNPGFKRVTPDGPDGAAPRRLGRDLHLAVDAMQRKRETPMNCPSLVALRCGMLALLALSARGLHAQPSFGLEFDGPSQVNAFPD